eukprot:ANDGO_02735.mRNA.1 Sensor histidine kinase RcsC
MVIGPSSNESNSVKFRATVLQTRVFAGIMGFLGAFGTALIIILYGDSSYDPNPGVGIYLIILTFLTFVAAALILYPRLSKLARVFSIVVIVGFAVFPLIGDIQTAAGLTADNLSNSEELDSLRQQSTGRFFLLAVVVAGLSLNEVMVLAVWLLETILLIALYFAGSYSVYAFSIMVVSIPFFALSVCGILMMVRSSYRRMEQERENFMALFHSMVDPIVVHRNGRIVASNHKFKSMFPLSSHIDEIFRFPIANSEDLDGERANPSSTMLFSQLLGSRFTPRAYQRCEGDVENQQRLGASRDSSISNESVVLDVECTVHQSRSHQSIVEATSTSSTSRTLTSISASTHSTIIPFFTWDHLADESTHSLWKDNPSGTKFPCILTTVRDLTEHNRMVSALQEAAAERARRDTTVRFWNQLTHELRTPLWSVIASAEVLQSLLVSTSIKDARVNQLVDAILRACNMLILLINDVLDRSRIERGSIILNPAACDISAVTDDVVEMLAPGLSDRGLTFGCFVSPLLPSSLMQDAIRIKQIMWNLLSNAIKFTRKGGQVELNVDYDARWKADTPGLCISVRDSGTGISPDVLDRIRKFEAWIPTGIPVPGVNISGSGLGLSICHGLASKMNGLVTIDSVLGEGTNVQIWVTANLTPNLSQVSSFREQLLGACIRASGDGATSFPDHKCLLCFSEWTPVTHSAHLEYRICCRMIQKFFESLGVSVSQTVVQAQICCPRSAEHTYKMEFDSVFEMQEKSNHRCMILVLPSCIGDGGAQARLELLRAAGVLKFTDVSIIAFGAATSSSSCVDVRSGCHVWNHVIRTPFRSTDLFRALQKTSLGPSPMSSPSKSPPGMFEGNVCFSTNNGTVSSPVMVTNSLQSVSGVGIETRVAFVEDDPVNRRITQQLISRAGFACFSCEDGWEAAKVWSKRCYSCILSLRASSLISDGIFKLCCDTIIQHLSELSLQLYASGKLPVGPSADSSSENSEFRVESYLVDQEVGDPPLNDFLGPVLSFEGAQTFALRVFGFDVGLVDQNMPFMNGAELLAYIRLLEKVIFDDLRATETDGTGPFSRAQIMFCVTPMLRFSADTYFDSSPEEFVAFDDALSKPCRKSELEDKLRKWASVCLAERPDASLS